MTQGRKGTPSEGFIYLLAGKDWMARFNMAWLLGPGDPEILLSKRKRYTFSDADLFRSAENAEAFTSTEPKLEASPKGYRLLQGKSEGRVVTQRMILPSGKMNLSYHVPKGGKLYVWLMDDSDTRLCDSHALTGAHQIDKPLEWQEGTIGKWLGKSVYVQFMLEGGAEVFGFSFDDVPATGDSTASIGPSDDGLVLPPPSRLPHGAEPGIREVGAKRPAVRRRGRPHGRNSHRLPPDRCRGQWPRPVPQDQLARQRNEDQLRRLLRPHRRLPV
jgi:hypothetical protein